MEPAVVMEAVVSMEPAVMLDLRGEDGPFLCR
jgi:hypothetical protein